MANSTETLQLRLALSGLTQVEAGFKSLVNTITSGIHGSIIPIAETLAGLAGIGAFAEMTKGVLELGSELNNLKARTGATIPELMAMRKLLQENGGSADQVAMLIQHMQKSIVE